MDKVKVKFLKKHPAGLKEGEERELDFLHAKRLKEQGYVEVQDYDQYLTAWEQSEKERKEKIQAKTDAIKAAEDEDQKRKAKLREENAVGKNRRQNLQTTDDIKNEEPKNSKKGGKNK